MNKEEYEIIFVPNKGRAIKDNKTKKIYYSEFEIIEEKNQEIARLNNIINQLEKWAKSIELTVYRSDGMPTYQYQAVLDKLKELKENK